MIRAVLVRFWGVRGATAAPGACVSAFGCHTACLEIRNEDTNDALILDAGTGIIGLGQALADEGGPVSLLLTHYRWDHVQGLPSFAPLFRPEGGVSIWAPALERSGRGAIEAAFTERHVPFSFDHLPIPPRIHPIEPGRSRVGGFDVEALRLNHPGGSFAYRVRGTTGDLVYISDHEFGNPTVDEPLAPFSLNSGATVLNSSWHQATEFASSTGAGYLWLVHHEAGRSDADLETIEAKSRRVYPATRAAREGDVFKL